MRGVHAISVLAVSKEGFRETLKTPKHQRRARLVMVYYKSSMKIGYARVSTEDQNPDVQMTALQRAGCKTIYTDKVEGTIRKRPQLSRCLHTRNAGDILVAWKLDRLGRSLSHLVGILEALQGGGSAFAV